MIQHLEPDGFAQWLGRYCRSGGGRVPKAGTDRRLALAELYEGLKSAGVAPVASDVGPRVTGSPERALEAAGTALANRQIRAGLEAGRVARRVGSFLFEWAPAHSIAVTEPMIAEVLRRVAALAPEEAPGGDLPEWVCRRCGGPNPLSWFAPSPLWNAVMRGGSIDGVGEFGEIICPTCFCMLAQERGVASVFVVDAREVHVELETVTPSGRVWDPEAMLWVDPAEDAENAS